MSETVEVVTVLKYDIDNDPIDEFIKKMRELEKITLNIKDNLKEISEASK